MRAGPASEYPRHDLIGQRFDIGGELIEVGGDEDKALFGSAPFKVQ
jgi:hypothetical protein